MSWVLPGCPALGVTQSHSGIAGSQRSAGFTSVASRCRCGSGSRAVALPSSVRSCPGGSRSCSATSTSPAGCVLRGGAGGGYSASGAISPSGACERTAPSPPHRPPTSGIESRCQRGSNQKAAALPPALVPRLARLRPRLAWPGHPPWISTTLPGPVSTP